MSYVSKEEFAEGVKKYQSDLYRLAMFYMKNDADAQDAVGDAVLKAFENRNALDDKEKFKSWILTILANTCQTTLKKKKRIVYVEDVWKNEEPVSKKPDEMRELVLELEDEFRQVVVLYYYVGLSVGEISSSLGVSKGTVKSRLARARKKLKVLL